MKLVVGNWKMHKNPTTACAFMDDLANAKRPASYQVQCILAVPASVLFCLRVQAQALQIDLCAQNMFYEDSGAYTGEMSGPMLRDAGAKFVLIGHSERRTLFGENLAIVAAKLKAAWRCGLRPILCIGETLTDYQHGKSLFCLQEQLDSALADVSLSAEQRLIIAYEPVWAIGTGKVADPSIITSIFTYLHQYLQKQIPTIQATPLLYGGSVNGDNTPMLFGIPQLSGLLIGGASLEATHFAQIAALAAA